MANSIHPIEQEVLMAYLDGELPVDRAARVAAHLEECGECREWVAESRVLAERLTDWEVEPAPQSLTERVTAAIRAGEVNPTTAKILPPPQPRPRIFGLPRWAWATAGVVCLFLIVVAISIPSLHRSRAAADRAAMGTMGKQTATEYLPASPASMPAPTTPASSDMNGLMKPAAAGGGGSESPVVTGPMIARTASLTLLSQDFEKTRAGLENVVRRHRGYDAQLTVSSESGSARTLSASFRVPADQLDAAISEIKQLAHVEQESQGGEEVTEQYVDLTARLSNARRTEQTLLDLLSNRTGKLSDVLEVEQELAKVREEIERMEAELKSLQNRVSFSTLQVELREEYKAELEMPPSLGRRMGNAVVEGFRTAADSLVGLALFFLNVGPVLLLWALILFWPLRYVWRRVRAAIQRK